MCHVYKVTHPIFTLYHFFTRLSILFFFLVYLPWMQQGNNLKYYDYNGFFYFTFSEKKSCTNGCFFSSQYTLNFEFVLCTVQTAMKLFHIRPAKFRQT